MLTIWGRTNSINVQKVMWTVGELGLEHRRLDVGGAFGGVDSPEYLAMNPNGRVPTLVDGDTIVWESNSCVRYLAAKYGVGTLWDDDPGERSKADRWMDWMIAHLNPDMTVIFWGLVRTPEPERDMRRIQRSVQALVPLWRMVDDRLSRHDFLAGGRFTMGDIPVGAMAHRWFNLPIDRPPLPHAEAWYARLRERPAYAAHVALPLS